MRVLHIVTAFPRFEGDVITPWLLETLKRLKEKGIEVTVFSPSYKGQKDHKIEGIKVRRFRYFLKRWENLTHEETAPDRVRRSFFYKLMVPFYLLGGTFGILKLCRKERYDIIHVHWPIPQGIFGYFGKFVTGSPLVSTFYGVELRWVKKGMPFLRGFLKWAINSPDAVIAISSHTANELKEIMWREINIIPYGTTIAERPRLERKSGKKNILFVGRLVERKGVSYLIEAMRIISTQVDAILTIVGEGPERDSLQKLVQEYGLNDKVIFKGKVDQKGLERCYENCDVFVLPAVIDSKGDTEGLGVVLLEAMSYKKPVIASNLGGIVDIVKDGKTGILVPAGDAKRIAESIIQVLKNEELAKDLGEAGYRFAKQHFDWEVLTQRLLSLYQSLLLG